MKINLLVIDIAEQSEIIDFTRQAIESLTEKFPHLKLNLKCYQLKSRNLESDFDFSPINIEDQIHLALFHTKIFKTNRGYFLEATWWIKFIQSVFGLGRINLCLYSGDIQEFKQWFEILKSNHTFETENLQFLDVFDLLYPPEEGSFDQWLEKQLAGIIQSIKNDG